MKSFTLLLIVAVAAAAVSQVSAQWLPLLADVTPYPPITLQTSAKFQVRTHDDAAKAFEDCREDNYVPDDIYEKFLNYEFPAHRRTSCFVKCFVEKMGLFSESRGFDEKAMIKQFTVKTPKDLDTVQHGLEKCIDHNEAESDVCTFANRVFSCWLPINRHVVRKVLADLAGEAKILENCLKKVSSPERIVSDLQKLERYPEWTSEEVPCLMRCLASEKGWFDIVKNKWQGKRLTDDIGADVYNYCRFELMRKSRDGCSFAYRGLRCLKQAELHAGTSLSTLLHCARTLNATNVELLQYNQLKTEEPIPCLFQCFADAMGFYDTTGNWRLLNWQQAFGPSRMENQTQEQPLDYSECRRSDKERKEATSKCSWMYEEYKCWERLNGNDFGEESRETS
uniref:Putative dimer odorant-binding protein OBP83EF n=1 Tax=Drosophila pseudoobscura pseudoobscura TaxID=46245 RepID=Q706D7_DROPS|nr:putative dimer odorant-binding protein OBP83EF [Drosophila pseudoobscura]